MALKLFRTTGYASLLDAGETQRARHPAWVVTAVSLWIGFVCNVRLWRDFANGDFGAATAQTFAIGAFVAAAAALGLNLLGWRKTLKPAASVVLLAGALFACTVWSQSLPVDASLLDKPPLSLLVPPWASFLRWQVPALLIALALVPMVWLWQVRVQRVGGPQQLRTNLLGAAVSAAVLAASAYLLGLF